MEEPQELLVDVTEEKIQENPKIESGVLKEKTSSENSEYDSVDSYSDEEEEQPPVTRARSKTSGLDSPRDSHSENEGSVILEREEGDGQESVPQKKVDDDEDKKNPQYIPKRGTFYEHDDRTAEDLEEQRGEEDPAKVEPESKKKVWQDKKEKWSHDKFDDHEQAPKSRQELVAIYGYDIRNEDGPPRARRRRRYGRGPNKYTRNWEDKNAYSKPPPARPQRKPKNPTREDDGDKEEFPPLGGAEQNRPRTKSKSSESNHDEHIKENDDDKKPFVKQEENRKSFERPDARIKVKPSQEQPQQFRSHNSKQFTENNSDQNYNRSNHITRAGSGRIVKPTREIKDSDYRGFTSKSRQQRGTRSENQTILPPRKRETDFIQSQNFTNKTNHINQVAELEKEINQLNIQDGVYKGSNRNNAQNSNQNRQGSGPPRLQNSEQQKSSKRYSSMRQRSLPETNTPPIPANFSFYPTDYNSTAPPPATQQALLAAAIPPPALVTPQVPVTAAPPPLLQAQFAPPPTFAAPPPPQAYLQAAPPQFIPPTAPPQIVSYVTQAQPAFVQGYQGQFNVNTVTQPAELYQPQGGITYYSADQQIAQRSVPLKRPKAAIPIVAPTDFLENKEMSGFFQVQREELNYNAAPGDTHEVQE
ncbi:unnamed protein product [Ceutorhynchus assimilis]|uniref:Protein CASC3 n=1 Tax=Ceutorhynchus assimilis TaxID=467358 RepID=A0A9N9MKH2_9CUCU|nr:unnamed protein product [Ceutorhynchus assimilis]